MPNRLRKVVLSVPVITTVILLALYLVGGFLVLPAVVKWQVEKQVQEQLGHRISVGEVRFNPLVFTFEVADLALSDPDGRPMLGFKRLRADFELRSVIDRAWTFAEATLEAPVVHFVLADGSRHNYSALIERLRDAGAQPEQPGEGAGAVPKIVVRRIALTQGRVEFSDPLLAPPLVTRIDPLQLEIDELSTLPAQVARYRLSLRTAAGETLAANGDLELNPVAARGTLTLDGLEVATLVRGLSRLVALDAPAGKIGLAASFDLAVDQGGAVSGTMQDVGFNVAKLSVAAAGAAEPLLALETLSLEQGRVDLDKRQVTFARFLLAKGRVAASADAQGEIDWAKILRASAAPPPTPPTPGTPAMSPAAAAPSATAATPPQPWRVAVASSKVSEIALRFSDASRGRSVNVSAVEIDVASTAEFGPAGMRVEFDQPKLSITGAQAVEGADSFGLPGAQIEVGHASFVAADRGFELTLDAPRAAAADGVTAKQGGATLALRGISVHAGRLALVGTGAATTGTIDAAKIVLVGASMSEPGRSAKLGEVSFDGKRIELRAEAGRVDASIEKPRGAFSNLQTAQAADGLDVRAVSITGETLALARSGAEIRMSVGAPAVVLSGLAARRDDGRAAVDELSFGGRRIALQSEAGRIDVSIEQLRSAVANLQSTLGADGLDLRAASIKGETLSVAQAGARLRVVAGTPAVALSGLAAHRNDQRAAVEELSFEGAAVTLSSSDGGKLDLALDGIRSAVSALVLHRGADGIDVRTATLGGDSISLALADGRIRVAGSGARTAASGVAARQGADRLALEDASFAAKLMSVSTGGEAPGPTGVEARLEGAALRLAAVGIVAQGAAAEVLRVTEAKVGADSLVLGVPDGAVALTGDGLTAALSDVVMNSPLDMTEMARLGSVTLAGGTLHLPDQVVTAEKLSVANGAAHTWLDAEGKFNGLILTRGAAAATAVAPVGVDDAAPSAPAKPWRLALKSAELDGFSVGFEDRRASPPLAVGLEAIRARIAALDTASATPMQVEVEAKLASGGDLRAQGSVRLDNAQSDLQVRLAGIALAPVQRYLSEFADLQIASGTVSSEGRLRYGQQAGAAALLTYEGGVAVDRLLLEQVDAKRPFLSWDAVASDDIVLTVEPNRMDIGELRLERLSGRLIIAPDLTVNLMDVLKKREKPEDAPAPPPQAAPAQDPFPVTIARLRVTDGALDFADLSLRPQFGARMHELEGVITGLGTDANSSAKLQLDALVDKYGSARIRGEISVLRPGKLTDIDMTFRNLEMTSLSPYVEKFAGYRIAAGRLALDLHYKVESGKLAGTNKIVLQQVELGEKVDSPGAMDLPLELALAILKDSDGVIDIGLPVSGNLDDPQFDYGAVIATAVGNMFSGLVKAPFGALGALFGGGGKPLDTIAFEPGSDAIAPPERQKLDAIARALKARPALSLVVPPTYAADQDTPVLKSRAVRADIVRRMGSQLAPGEDPGPIDAANPRAQRAIEASFSERNSPAALAALKRRAVPAAASAAETAAPGGKHASPATAPSQAQPASGKPPAGSGATGPPAQAAAGVAPSAKPPPVPPPVPPPEFYESLVTWLIGDATVPEPMLARLAARRGEAIVREVTTTGGVPAARVKLGALHKATEATDKAVTLRLALDVAK